MSNIDIRYNNASILGNIKGPIPFFSLDSSVVRLEKFFGSSETVFLTGQLVFDCSDSMSDKINAVNNLLSPFLQQYKSFSVYEDGRLIFERENVRFVSVSVDESSFGFLVDYKIELAIDNFGNSGIFSKIASPSFEISYSIEGDGSISANLNFSVQALSSDFLSEAIEFAENGCNLSEAVLPSVNIGSRGFDINKAILVSKDETLDRFSLSYSISKIYKIPQIGRVPFFLSQDYEIAYNEEEGFYTCSITGFLEGCPEKHNMTDVRSAFNNLNFYLMCRQKLLSISGSFPGISSPPGLSQNPKQISIDEVENKRIINFSFSYDSNLNYSPGAFEYEVTAVVSSDDKSESYASMKGTVSANVHQSIADAHLYSVGSNFARGVCCQAMGLLDGNVVLKDRPSNYSVLYNEREKKYEISYTFNEKNQYASFPDVDELSYSVEVDVPVNVYVPFPTLNGADCFDLQAKKRGTVTVAGSARASGPDLCSNINLGSFSSFVKGLAREYGGQFLESSSVTTGEDSDGKFVSFNISMSFD